MRDMELQIAFLYLICFSIRDSYLGNEGFKTVISNLQKEE